jgi:hypothetical protein
VRRIGQPVRVTSDGVRRVPDDERDETLLEAWERVTDEPDLRLVDANRGTDPGWPWRVGAAVMEFIRSEPLESELRDAMFLALSGVVGVTEVAREDREVWVVAGSPDGDALVHAAASVVDAYLSQTRAEYDSLT